MAALVNWPISRSFGSLGQADVGSWYSCQLKARSQIKLNRGEVRGTTHSDGLFLDVLESRLGHTLALELVTDHGEGCGRAQLLGALAEDDAPLG